MQLSFFLRPTIHRNYLKLLFKRIRSLSTEPFIYHHALIHDSVGKSAGKVTLFQALITKKLRYSFHYRG